MSNLTYILKTAACVARVIVFIGILLSLGVKGEPVTVTLYYSMLCNHSKVFITQFLYPAWKTLTSNFVQVDFVQYGTKKKPVEDSSGKFQCRVIPEECEGNKETACAMKLLQCNRTLQMEYIFCVMNSTWAPKAGPECSKELKINFSTIKQCKEGQLGLKLVEKLSHITSNAKPPIKGFPWITFNGVYDRESHKKAWVNLTSVLCDKLESSKPQSCMQ